MANPAQRIRNQYSNATVVERGRNFIRHQLADGRMALDASIGPLHVENSTTEINTAWQAVTGAWQYQIAVADYVASARNVLNAGDAIEYRHPSSQQWVTFQPLSLNWINQDNSRQQIAITQAVVATVDDDTLIWQNGLGTGRHFRYKADTASLQKLIIIDSASSLPAATVSGTVWFEAEFQIKNSADVDLYINGNRWPRSNNARVTTTERIEFRQLSTGNLLWWLDYGRVWDSAGNETTGQLQVRRSGPNYFITVRIPKPWIDSASFPVYIDPTINTSVAASTDDGVQTGAIGTMTLNGVNIRLGISTSWGAFRFLNITVPQGATIDAAYIDIQRAAQDVANLDIYAQDADDTSTLTTTANDISSRPRTTAFVNWNATLGGATDSRHNSPEIKTVIQEVIDRAGWTSGNSLMIIMDCHGGDVGIRAYDNGASTAALLHIEYTAAGAGTFTATGTAALSPLTATGSATHTAPIFAATGATALGALSGNGLAEHDAPTFAATGAGTLGALTGTGAASYAGLTFTATGAGTLGAFSATGSATHSAPLFEASASVSLSALTGIGTAEHDAPIFTASGTGTLAVLSATGSATVSVSSYTASGAGTLGSLTATGSATVTAPTFAASGASTLPALTGTGAAAHDAPVYTASGSGSLGALAGSGAASFATSVFAATGQGTLGALEAIGSASFDAGTFSAAGAGDLPSLIGEGDATHDDPVSAASGNVTLGALSGSGTASFVTVSRNGTGAPVLPLLTGSGSASYIAPIRTATGALVLSVITGTGTADNAPSIGTGQTAATLPALLAYGIASYRDTGPRITYNAWVEINLISRATVEIGMEMTEPVEVL